MGASCPSSCIDKSGSDVLMSAPPELVTGLTTDFGTDGQEEATNSLRHVHHFGADLCNHIIAQMWPTAQLIFNEILMNQIEPAVKEKLGSHGGLFEFDSDCSIGDTPMHLHRQSVHQTVQETTDGKLANLVLRNDVDWQNDELRAAIWFDKIKLGVKRLHIRCSIICEIVGLKGQPPFFNGIRAFITNPPSVDLDMETNAGFLNKVLHLSFIKRSIVDTIVEVVSKVLVVPNRLKIWRAKDTDVFRIFFPRPKGVLTIILTRLDGLEHAHASEPYVHVRCGAIELKMQIPHGGKGTPSCIDLPVYMPSHQVVHFQVRSKHFTKDDFLGDGHSSVAHMISWGGQQERSVELQLGKDPDAELTVSSDTHLSAKPSGSIALRAEWRPLHLALEDADYHGSGLLFVGVHFVSHLPVGEEGSKVRVKLTCTQIAPHAHLQGHQVTKWKLQETKSGLHQKAELQTLVRKVEICQKNRMSLEDMVEVLEVDKERIAEIQTSLQQRQKQINVSGVGGRHRVDFDEAFEFLLAHADDAVITFEVVREQRLVESMRQAVSSSVRHLEKKTASVASKVAGALHIGGSKNKEVQASEDIDAKDGEQQVVGHVKVRVKDLIDKRTDNAELNLEGSDAVVCLRMQIRMLDQPKTSRLD